MNCKKCKIEMKIKKVLTGAFSQYKSPGSMEYTGGIKTYEESFFYCDNEECEHFALLKIELPRVEM